MSGSQPIGYIGVLRRSSWEVAGPPPGCTRGTSMLDPSRLLGLISSKAATGICKVSAAASGKHGIGHCVSPIASSHGHGHSHAH